MRSVAVLVCGLALRAIACSSGKGSASAKTPIQTTTTRPRLRCHTAELQAAPGVSDAATGHEIVYVSLHNTSQRTCQLLGYPGVTLADANGNPIPTKDQRGSGLTVPIQLALCQDQTLIVSPVRASTDEVTR